MRLIYADIIRICNSIDVNTFENVVLRTDCNKARGRIENYSRLRVFVECFGY